MKKLPSLIIGIAISIIAILSVCKGCMDSNDTGEDTIAALPPIDKRLQQRIDSFVAAETHCGSLGLMVYDIDARQTVYALNEDTMMRPASCMKLLTCIAAMRYLTPNYKFHTELYTQGTMRNDTLVGDIVVKTSFDTAFIRDSLENLLRPLQQKGIKAIKGRVLLDMKFTEQMDHEQHWIVGDLKVNRMGLILQGLRRMKVETLYALRRAANINVRPDSIRLGRVNPRRAEKVSETVTSIHHAIEKSMRNSSNINAEALTYVLGYNDDPHGNYRAHGREVLRKFVKEEMAMNPQKVCLIDDGCGLCPDDRLTPRLLANLLLYAHQRPAIYKELLADLPLSGVDGTLHDRLTKPNVKGKIQAKTGTLTREGGISTLAGYYTAPDGHRMVFVVMNNECPVAEGRRWQDRLIERTFLPAEKKR